MEEGGPLLNSENQLDEHRLITSEVHKAGGRIVLQILHAGRYAKVSSCVAPSSDKARINVFPPRPLDTAEVWGVVDSFVNTSVLAKEAGYHGVEIMGSEGYLLNEFTASTTNKRGDEFGGSYENRIRLSLEIIKAVRKNLGQDFMIIYRISAIDLIDDGMTRNEIAEFARRVEAAGADMINTGVGWHESAVPTIAASVPRAAWVNAVRNVKAAVSIPVMASNRINTPEVAEEIIASGAADMVSMARPLLADPDFAKKVRLGNTSEINTCIACNQACLDRIFTDRTATCLVNPRAGREIEFKPVSVVEAKRIAVVGGGPAGMAFAVNAAERGHDVTLFEASNHLGGQLNMARVVPGKSEFNELLRYFQVMLDKHRVTVVLGKTVGVEDLKGLFDETVIATGVSPRVPDFPGVNHSKVVNYIDVLTGRVTVGHAVAIIGAGGIGFDVAEYLLGNHEESLDTATFFKAWGVDGTNSTPGGLLPPQTHEPRHTVHMFQRKTESLGKNLGKSTGWILKARLRKAGVTMTSGVSYEAIDDQGLHYSVDGKSHVMPVDHVILCAGQVSNRDLYTLLDKAGINSHVIGGADVASELDALRAIDQATRLAVSI
jgi:2,4-dienoyl-CoA reductase (NADPH2)